MTAPATVSPFAGLRRPARWLRRLRDRWLHPLRRRRAVRALRQRGTLGRVLVVCHGNICRSPYAAAVLQRGVAASALRTVRVDSAGFIGPGRTPPPVALAVAAARGYDLAAHRSCVVAENELPEYDLILVMDRAQQRRIARVLDRPRPLVLLLGDFDSTPVARRAIPDPVDGPPALFGAVYERIDRCVASLLNALEGDHQRGLPVNFSIPRR